MRPFWRQARKPGEPVAIVARNGPGVVAASYGVMASGAAEFVVDLNLGPDDIAYAMRILGVRRAVVERNELPRVAPLGLDVMVLEDILERPARDVVAPFDPHAWGKAIMTSGTTGRPKAIVHRHDRRWIAHELLRAHLPFVPGANDRVLLMNAYSHGVALLAATWFECGASVELIGGVDVAYADELFARGELTAVFAPPTVLAKLVAGTRHKRIDGIKCIFCGTATLQPALHRAATALFGPVIRVTYGKSEMFNPITCSKWTRPPTTTAISSHSMRSVSARRRAASRWRSATKPAVRVRGWRARRNPSAQPAHDDRPCGR